MPLACIAGIIWSFLFYVTSPLNSGVHTNSVKQKTSKSQHKWDTQIENIWGLEAQIIQTVQEASPSIVSIVIKKDLVVYRSDPWGFFRQALWSVQQKIGGWTGFFISSDGKIITNKHVVSQADAQYSVISNDGVEYDASVIALDPENDIAVLQIDQAQISDTSSFQTLEFIQDSDEIQLGQFAIAIWNALAEFNNSVSLWIVSWKNRMIQDNTLTLSGLIQTDAAINPWNSWGPLLTRNGKVMWINTLIIGNSEWIGFAIPITQQRIKEILETISGTQ